MRNVAGWTSPLLFSASQQLKVADQMRILQYVSSGRWDLPGLWQATQLRLPRLRLSLSSSTNPRTLRRLGHETALDGLHGPCRTARLARHEEQTIVLSENRVRRLARFASDVFDNVSTQDVLNLL